MDELFVGKIMAVELHVVSLMLLRYRSSKYEVSNTKKPAPGTERAYALLENTNFQMFLP